MKLTIEINTDNAAFGDPAEGDPIVAQQELQEIFSYERFTPNESGKIFDSNGNSVGFWEWK